MSENNLVLIIDDDQTSALLIASLLKNSGYTTRILVGSQNFLEVVRNHRNMDDLPGLILLDLAIPDNKGLELVRQIKADTSLPFIPIVVTTNNIESDNRISGLQTGADDYLIKPVQEAELIARVRSLLRLKNLYDEKTHLLNEVQSAYNRLNNTQVELVEMEKKKAQMEAMITTAAAICHEMSQPLTSALITLQFVYQDEHKHNADLEAIEQSLLQARTVFDKLRALTRYETKPYIGTDRILDLDRSSQQNNLRNGSSRDDRLIG